MSAIANFEKLLAAGQDSALLRYSLGNAYYKEGEPERAVEHLSKAVAQDPSYSAAWKMYGKVLVELGRLEQAADAYAQGIAVAEQNGDIQAAKEMKVFLRRVEKTQGG
jgi:predicted Zn-dependent protease